MTTNRLPPTKPKLETPAVTARQMSDAMLATLLHPRVLTPALVAQTRTAFVAYCEAHPHLADVRTAWRAFHHQLETA